MRTTILLALCFIVCPFPGKSQDTPPNILLIIADQHTGKIMSQRGYPHVNTPGIDKIADE